MFGFFHNLRSESAIPALPGGDAGFHAPSDVKSSVHADGLVLMHACKGTLFSANRVGAMIWTGAVERWGMERLATAISSEFDIPPQTARHDAAAFLAQLEAAGLLIRDAN